MLSNLNLLHILLILLEKSGLKKEIIFLTL